MKFISKVIWGFGAGLMLILLISVYCLNRYLLDQGYYFHLFICAIFEGAFFFVTKLWFLGAAIFYTVCLIHALYAEYRYRTRTNMDVYIKQIAYVMASEMEGHCCHEFADKAEHEQYFYNCESCKVLGICGDHEKMEEFLKERYKK